MAAYSRVRSQTSTSCFRGFGSAFCMFLGPLLGSLLHVQSSCIRRRWGKLTQTGKVWPWRQDTWWTVGGACQSRPSLAWWRDWTGRDTCRKRCAGLRWLVLSCSRHALCTAVSCSLSRRSCMERPIWRRSLGTSSSLPSSQGLTSFRWAAWSAHALAVSSLALRFRRRREVVHEHRVCILSTTPHHRYSVTQLLIVVSSSSPFWSCASRASRLELPMEWLPSYRLSWRAFRSSSCFLCSRSACLWFLRFLWFAHNVICRSDLVSIINY